MVQDSCNRANSGRLSRRMLLKAMGAVAAVSVPHVAMAQAPPSGPVAPPSTVTTPPRADA